MPSDLKGLDPGAQQRAWYHGASKICRNSLRIDPVSMKGYPMARQWIKNCSGVLIAVILAGCGSMGAQFASIGEVSESEPHARLRVLGGSGFVRGVPDSNCLDWSKPGAGTIIGGLVGAVGFVVAAWICRTPSGAKANPSRKFMSPRENLSPWPS